MRSFPFLKGFTPPREADPSPKAEPSAEPPPPSPSRGRGRFRGSWVSPPRAQPPPGAAVVGGPGPAAKGEILAPSRGLPPPAWPQGTRLGEKRAFLGFAQQRSPAAFPAAAGGSPSLSRPLPAPPGSTGSPPATPGASAEPPALSITSRGPQDLGSPWGWHRPPRGGFFSSTGSSGKAACLPGRNRNSWHGREQQRRENPLFPTHFMQRCVISCMPGHTSSA